MGIGITWKVIHLCGAGMLLPCTADAAWAGMLAMFLTYRYFFFFFKVTGATAFIKLLVLAS